MTVCSVGLTDLTILCDRNISVCNGRYDWSEPVYSQSCYYARYVTVLCASAFYAFFIKLDRQFLKMLNKRLRYETSICN